MTKQEAESYLKGEVKDTSLEVKEEVKEVNEPQEPSSLESNPEKSVTDESRGTDSQTESVLDYHDEVSEKNQTEDKSPKKRFTREDRQKHAFKMEKEKRRRITEQLRLREEEVKDLKERLEKYQNLQRADFNSDEEYSDYRMDWKLAQRELREKTQALEERKRLEDRRDRIEENKRRVNLCFPSENERNQYQNLITEGEVSFGENHPEYGVKTFSEFLASEPDLTLVRYLEDSENSPRLLRHFLLKPDTAKRIMSMKNPLNKVMELRALESRMVSYFSKKNQEKNQENHTPEKRLPQTGSIARSNSLSSGVKYNQAWSKKDAESWLQSRR